MGSRKEKSQAPATVTATNPPIKLVIYETVHYFFNLVYIYFVSSLSNGSILLISLFERSILILGD